MRDRLLASAEETEGLERARRLDAALAEVEGFALPDHAAVVEEVLALDADDEAGLRSRWWAAWAEPRLDRRLQEAVFPLIGENRFADARAALAVVRDAEPLPPVLLRKLSVFAAQLRFSAGDADAARAELAAVLADTPAGEEADAYRELLGSMDETGG